MNYHGSTNQEVSYYSIHKLDKSKSNKYIHYLLNMKQFLLRNGERYDDLQSIGVAD